MTDNPRPTLMTARTTAEILEAVARREWWQAHAKDEAKRDACPADMIPSETALAEWLPGCPADDHAASIEQLAAMRLIGPEAEPWTLHPDSPLKDRPPPQPAAEDWRWTVQDEHTAFALRLRESNPDADVDAVLDLLDAAGMVAPPRLVLACNIMVAVWEIEDIHARWRAIPDAERRAHPLAPIVRAWQEWKASQPRETKIDRAPSGIMPNFAGKRLHNIIRPDPGDMPDFGGSLPLRRPDPSGQLWLPGLDLDAGGAAAFILAILDAGSDAQRSAGAPLRDRFFAELLMAAERTARADGERHSLHGLTVADPVDWAAWNPKHYRPDDKDYGHALARGLSAVNRVQLPLNDRGGWLIPAFVEAVKGRRLSDPVIASVRLPEGSDHGARVDRAVLRQAGRVSAVAWRLYLASCFEWNRIAHKGRTPHLSRPEVLRDGRGRLLDASGNLILGPDPAKRKGATTDTPATDWRDSRAIETGERESNPQGESLHRVYDGPEDLVRAVWPLSLPPGAKANPKRSEEQAAKAAQWLAGELDGDGKPILLNRQSIAAPGTRIVRSGSRTKANPLGFPWRIVPPWTK